MAFQVIIFTDLSASVYKNKPLGAYHIANQLRRNGYSVLVIDHFSRYLRNLNMLDELLINSVDQSTMLVGFSSTFFTVSLPEEKSWSSWLDYYGWDQQDFWCGQSKQTVEDLFARIRRLSPDVKFSYGGMLSTQHQQLIKQSPKLDYVTPGYGESHMLHLLDHLTGQVELRYRLAHDFRTRIIDWDMLAKDYDFHSCGVVNYEPQDVVLPNETLSLQTSRGCMYNCAFCSFPMRGSKRDRKDYHLNWLDLAEYFKRNWELYGVSNYQIVDDTFNETTEKIINFERAIELSGIDISWFSFMRVDLIDQEQLAVLRDSHCSSIWLGIETLNESSLKQIHKRYSAQQALSTIEAISRETSIKQYASVIFGLPGDTETTIRSWMQDLIDSSVDCIGINSLGVHERTPWSSDINREPEKFGITLTHDGGASELAWKTESFTGTRAWQLTTEYHELLWQQSRNGIAGFDRLGLLQHGMSEQELDQLTVDQLPYKRIMQNHHTRFREYHQQLRTLLS